MDLILIIIASLGLVTQYTLDFFIKNKKTKKWIGIIILLLTIVGVWGSYFSQKNDNQDLTSRLDTMKIQSLKLQTTLELRNNELGVILLQNDSLKFLIHDLSKTQKEFLIISKKSVDEVSRSREVIQNISNKSFSRGISELDKIEMSNVLKANIGSNVIITSVMGDSEAFQFANEIKEVFTTAGWKVDGLNQALFNKPVSGIKIRVKNSLYPSRVNTIISAFNVLRLKVEGWLYENLSPDDVEIIVGAK